MSNLVSNVYVNKILRFSSPSIIPQQILSRPLRGDHNVLGGGKLIQKNLRHSFLIVETLFWFLEANKLKKMNVFIFVSTACYPFRQVTANVFCTIFCQITKQVIYVLPCEKSFLIKSSCNKMKAFKNL